MQSMALHLKHRHPKEAQALAHDIGCLHLLLSAYLLLKLHVDLSASDRELQEHYHTAEEALMNLFSDQTKPVS